MSKWISVYDKMPYDGALCWITIGWQHYAGETAVALCWYKGGHWYDVFIDRETGQPAKLNHAHDSNWQFAATHWMNASDAIPKAPFPYVLRDGAEFAHRPTVKELSEH